MGSRKDRDYGYLNTDHYIKTRNRTNSNIFEIDGKEYAGVKRAYEDFFQVCYPGEFCLKTVTHLLQYNKLSVANREKHPELDPDNPDKIWDRVSLGSISKSSRYRGTKRVGKKNYGLIYYLLDSDFNRYYGFTVRAISDEIGRLDAAIESGAMGQSTDPDDYEIHVYDAIALENHRDTAARETIDVLIKKFIWSNPDRRAVSLIDLI